MNKKQNSLMRFSRTERLAQLSEQEIVIERKKREIQAKLEAQKKKQTEETLRKLESSRETKKPGFSKNSSWSGTEHQKSSSKEKSAEQVQESLTNAFSNDGSFLDHFKKLSQTGLSANNVEIQSQSKSKAVEGDSKKVQCTHDDNAIGRETREKGGSATDRYHRLMLENNQPSSVEQPLDSKVEFQIPPSKVVQLTTPYQNILVLPSAVDTPASMVPSHSALIPQFQGGMQNPIHASQYTHPIKVQPVLPVQLPQSGTVFNLIKQDDSSSPEAGHNKLSTATPISIQPPLPVMPQNIPPPSPIQVQNIPPPPVPPAELPKLRTESISMTLKSNTVKKLEAIPNPLEIDQPPSPPSPKKSNLSFMGTREGSKETVFNITPLVENISSNDRDSSRISSAFSDNEDGEEGDFSDERYHHWAKLVARCGDSFEDCLRNRNQNDANIRFLFDKNSKKYLAFRKLVSVYRRRMRCSEEELLGKTGKLNSPTDHEKSVDGIISSDNKAKLSSKFSDEGNCDLKESSDIEASVGRKESRTHSKLNENREDCLSHNKASELMSQEDCCLPSQKQFTFSRDTLGENSKEGRCGKMSEQLKTEERRKRKRKSRWGDAVPTTTTPGVTANITLQPAGKLPTPKSTLLSQLTRSDPGLIQYARQTFGSTNLSEEDWKKAEDHYKINLLYQDMVKKRAEVEKLERQGKFKYEYDSDEDTEGGTWEHKLRQQEMQATQLWAEELTRQAAGKHHIGDFLPPEELERFMEKYNAVKEGREPDLSDYKEYKLKEDNVGYRLLQKMGWNEGQGLGQDGSGITKPVNKATTRHENQGLGIDRPDGLEPGDDEYDAYRKRMMLAYRFRPNPLNNPRRPYY